jgi:hypothetical protein
VEPAVLELNQSRAARLDICSQNRLFAFCPEPLPMLDVIMLVIGFVFFAASIAYVYACDQL